MLEKNPTAHILIKCCASTTSWHLFCQHWKRLSSTI